MRPACAKTSGHAHAELSMVNITMQELGRIDRPLRLLPEYNKFTDGLTLDLEAFCVTSFTQGLKPGIRYYFQIAQNPG